MSNAVWPGTLPQYFLQEGYSEAPPDNAIRSNMEIGPAKIRRRTTANTLPISGQIALKVNGSVDQVTLLDDFYNDTLKSGSLPFDWKHPRTQAAATFRFVSRPFARIHKGTIWRADLQLEILP